MVRTVARCGWCSRRGFAGGWGPGGARVRRPCGLTGWPLRRSLCAALVVPPGLIGWPFRRSLGVGRVVPAGLIGWRGGRSFLVGVGRSAGRVAVGVLAVRHRACRVVVSAVGVAPGRFAVPRPRGRITGPRGPVSGRPGPCSRGECRVDRDVPGRDDTRRRWREIVDGSRRSSVELTGMFPVGATVAAGGGAKGGRGEGWRLRGRGAAARGARRERRRSSAAGSVKARG